MPYIHAEILRPVVALIAWTIVMTLHAAMMLY